MGLLIRYNLLSLLSRPATTFASLGLIAIIIATFSYLQAVTDSAIETMAKTGDPNTLLIMSQAAEAETVSGMSKEQLDKLDTTPGVVSGDSGPVVSAEIVAISSGTSADDEDVQINIAVRGVDLEMARRVRHDKIEILAGRAFKSGTYEVIIGASATRMSRDHGIGDRVLIGTRGMREFEIVGIFTTAGTSADSEIWGDVETLRDVYGRTRYSSARMLVPDAEQAQEAIDYISGPSVELTAKSEREYFKNINTNSTATRYLSVAMILIMGTAAVFAVANTMYATIAGRSNEIGMLRALGFGRGTVLLSFVFEGLTLATAGGLLGCGLSFWCHGLQRNMLPGTFTTVAYSLEITPKILFFSMAVAVLVGFLGTLLPAWSAARLSVIGTLREG